MGARQSLRYLGDLIADNWSILFFPEGERTEAGEIKPFQPGVGLIAGRGCLSFPFGYEASKRSCIDTRDGRAPAEWKSPSDRLYT